jgi:hypothetical protein
MKRVLMTGLTLLLCAAGCGEPEPGPSPAPPAPAPPPPAAEAQLLPTNHPPEVPLPADRRVNSFSQRPDGTVSLTVEVPDPRDVTADFFRRELAGTGWQVTRDSLDGGMSTLAGVREDGGRITVNIIENPQTARTMIGLSYRLGSKGR